MEVLLGIGSHTKGFQEELEKVQNRAARFVTRNYTFEEGSMTGILEQLKWESLKKRRTYLSSDDLEILCCNILLPKTRPILVGACYRPPKQNDFIDKLEELLFKVRTDSEIYLLDDFNICFFSKMLKFIQKVY